MSVPDPKATQKAAKLATKIVWGAAKSVMTMSIDKGLLEAGFSAAEMGVQRVRQMHAKKYAEKVLRSSRRVLAFVPDLCT